MVENVRKCLGREQPRTKGHLHIQFKVNGISLCVVRHQSLKYEKYNKIAKTYSIDYSSCASLFVS